VLQFERQEIRERAALLITNPDMLHCSILPVHKTFGRLLAHLRYVVVDEGHAYRFGQPFTCLLNLFESQSSCKATCLTFWRTCAMPLSTRATPTGESWVLKVARATLNMIHVGAPAPTDRQCFGQKRLHRRPGSSCQKLKRCINVAVFHMFGSCAGACSAATPHWSFAACAACARATTMCTPPSWSLRPPSPTPSSTCRTCWVSL